VFLPVDRDHYEAISAEVMSALRSDDTVVEVLGWDEAFLAVEADDPEYVARQLQERVRVATGLECSVGIGRNRLQAKLATGFGKPAGVFRITGATWFDVLGDRPTDALWGIGPKTARKLTDLGISTVRQLAETDEDVLIGRFGPTNGPWLLRLAQGRDSATVVGTPYVARSRGREVTYQEDIADWDRVRREVVSLARRVAEEIADGGPLAVRVVVKVRFVPFTTVTHSRTLGAATVNPDLIEQAALEALDRFTPGRSVRLLGVRTELQR
jgi:DNA polymerase-4